MQTRSVLRSTAGLAVLLAIGLGLGACGKSSPPPPPPQRVEVVAPAVDVVETASDVVITKQGPQINLDAVSQAVREASGDSYDTYLQDLEARVNMIYQAQFPNGSPDIVGIDMKPDSANVMHIIGFINKSPDCQGYCPNEGDRKLFDIVQNGGYTDNGDFNYQVVGYGYDGVTTIVQPVYYYHPHTALSLLLRAALIQHTYVRYYTPAPRIVYMRQQAVVWRSAPPPQMRTYQQTNRAFYAQPRFAPSAANPTVQVRPLSAPVAAAPLGTARPAPLGAPAKVDPPRTFNGAPAQTPAPLGAPAKVDPPRSFNGAPAQTPAPLGAPAKVDPPRSFNGAPAQTPAPLGAPAKVDPPRSFNGAPAQTPAPLAAPAKVDPAPAKVDPPRTFNNTPAQTAAPARVDPPRAATPPPAPARSFSAPPSSSSSSRRK